MLYVYIGFLAFGVLYTLASLIFGAHGSDHGVDHSGIDTLDHSAAHSSDNSNSAPSLLNPVVLASAITAFGAIGLVAKLGFMIDDLTSLIISTAFAGVIGASIFFGIVKFMYGSQSNSVFSLDDMIGTEAEVITPIPKSGVGEIAYIINGIRYNNPARADDRKELSRGTVVLIKGFSGNTATVQRNNLPDDPEWEYTNESLGNDNAEQNELNEAEQNELD